MLPAHRSARHYSTHRVHSSCGRQLLQAGTAARDGVKACLQQDPSTGYSCITVQRLSAPVTSDQSCCTATMLTGEASPGQVLEQLAQLQPGSRSTTPQPGSQGPPLLPTPPRPDQLPTNLGLRQQAAFQGQATAQHGYPAPGPAQAPNPAAWSQVFSQGLPSPAGAQPSSSAGPPLSGLDLLLSLQRTQQQQQQQQQLQLQSQAVAAQHAGLGPQHLQQLQQQLPAEQAMRYQSPQVWPAAGCRFPILAAESAAEIV